MVYTPLQLWRFSTLFGNTPILNFFLVDRSYENTYRISGNPPQGFLSWYPLKPEDKGLAFGLCLGAPGHFLIENGRAYPFGRKYGKEELAIPLFFLLEKIEKLLKEERWKKSSGLLSPFRSVIASPCEIKDDAYGRMERKVYYPQNNVRLTAILYFTGA